MRFFVLFSMLFYVENGFCQSIRDDKVYFPKSCIDAGEIPEKGDHTFLFPFQNVSSSPIKIEYIPTSSGCVFAKYNKEPIAPDRWDTIKGLYYTEGRPGHTVKQMWVKFEGSDIRYDLQIKGCVVPYQGKISFKYYPSMDTLKRQGIGQLYIDKPTKNNITFLVQNLDSFAMKLSTSDFDSQRHLYGAYFCESPKIVESKEEIEANTELYKGEVTLLPKEKIYLTYLFSWWQNFKSPFMNIYVNDEEITIRY
jgi:hypothetical protein